MGGFLRASDTARGQQGPPLQQSLRSSWGTLLPFGSVPCRMMKKLLAGPMRVFSRHTPPMTFRVEPPSSTQQAFSHAGIHVFCCFFGRFIGSTCARMPAQCLRDSQVTSQDDFERRGNDVHHRTPAFERRDIISSYLKGPDVQCKLGLPRQDWRRNVRHDGVQATSMTIT